MIISLEGTRCSGKTYGENILKNSFPDACFLPTAEQYKILHKYIPQFKTREQIEQNENYFLEQTHKKLVTASKEHLSFVNRDFLSLYAFSRAYFDLYKKGNPNKMLEKIVKLKSPLPDFRILFQVTPALIMQRQRKRINNEPIWLNEEFVTHLIGTYNENKDFLGIKSIIMPENHSTQDLEEAVKHACNC